MIYIICRYLQRRLIIRISCQVKINFRTFQDNLVHQIGRFQQFQNSRMFLMSKNVDYVYKKNKHSSTQAEF